MKKLFSLEECNTGRQIEFDIAEGYARYKKKRISN